MKCCFDREHIDKELPGVVLISHGQLALGLLDAARIVMGEAQNVAAFCLEGGDDIAAYQAAFMDAYHSYPECLIMTDMKGGTPCNMLLRYGKEHGEAINGVTGASLPMLLEVLGMRDHASGEEMRAAALEAGQVSAVNLHQFLIRKSS